jgi:hypothetical protein
LRSRQAPVCAVDRAVTVIVPALQSTFPEAAGAVTGAAPNKIRNNMIPLYC